MKSPGSKSAKTSREANGSSTQRKRLKGQAARIEAAIQAAVREALIQHKRAGNPIAVWENGRVVWIPPEEIEIYDLP
jgi:hypothetical protein